MRVEWLHAVGWYYSWGYQPLAERLDRSRLAASPNIENDPPASITQTDATLIAHVDSNGAFGGSDCHFEVAVLPIVVIAPVLLSATVSHMAQGRREQTEPAGLR